MHVLVVEDEKKTAAFIRKALLAEGFAVDVVHDGDEVAHLAAATSFDAIVMDIMLPKRDGISALRQLRARKITTPVLLLSARGEVDERVEGLNAGADDYLPKPFVLAELIARVRALGRRSMAHLPVELRLANLLLNTATRTALRDSTGIELTSREIFAARVFDALDRAHLQPHVDPGARLGLHVRSGHEHRGCLYQACARKNRHRLHAAAPPQCPRGGLRDESRAMTTR